MADVHDKATRSFNMSQIKSKDTRPELLVRKYLHKNGIRFRLHSRKLPGKPDLYLRKYNTVIFINGCFWHGHKNCKYFVLPKTRRAWWKEKIEGNKRNDVTKRRELKKLKLKIIVIWECELKKSKLEKTLKRLLRNIRQQ